MFKVIHIYKDGLVFPAVAQKYINRKGQKSNGFVSTETKYFHICKTGKKVDLQSFYHECTVAFLQNFGILQSFTVVTKVVDKERHIQSLSSKEVIEHPIFNSEA